VSARRPLPWIYPLPEVHGLDPGIEEAVRVLRADRVWTSESCEGGPGHSFAEPTVCFAGEFNEGFRALAVVLQAGARDQIGMRLSALRRVYTIIDGEPTGPEWELVWWPSNSGTLCRECGQRLRPPECACTQSASHPGNSPCCGNESCPPQSPCDTPCSLPEPQLPNHSQHSSQNTSCSPREGDGIAPDPSQVIP
jgi:hypothetical protein